MRMKYLKFYLSNGCVPHFLYSLSGFYIHVFSNILNLLSVSYKMSYYRKKMAKNLVGINYQSTPTLTLKNLRRLLNVIRNDPPPPANSKADDAKYVVYLLKPGDEVGGSNERCPLTSNFDAKKLTK